MGRLNYTNASLLFTAHSHRKSEGLKLGQVVAKDLLKRIPPSTGFKAALRDPIVELDIAGRELTDDGFLEAASALTTSIEFEGGHGKVVRLEELCLRGNLLTAKSLKALGQIVSLAAHDLRDLDLSDNLIAITTDDDTAAWEEFLVSFSGCCVLRRIDFSGNALGARAFEILTRVYGKEDPVDLFYGGDVDQDLDHSIRHLKLAGTDLNVTVQRARKLSVLSDSDGYVSDVDSVSGANVHGIKGSRYETKSPEKASQATVQPNLFHMYATVRGLRSVPYLILSDTAMTEAGALHLSYIVACHNVPEKLLTYVPQAKAGLPAQVLSAYDSTSGCTGIVYLPNLHLGSAGLKVLELSELARAGSLEEPPEEELSGEFRTPSKPAIAFRRASEAYIIPAANNRRRSGTSTASGEQGWHGTGTDLDRARSRIQGNILRDGGPRSNDLWRAAMKMLSSGRCIRPVVTKDDKIPPCGQYTLPTSQNQTHQPKPRQSSLSAPLAPGNPNLPLIPRITENWKGTVIRVPHPAPKLTPPSSSTPVIHTPPNPPARPYRSNLPCGLPQDVWRKIIAYAAGANGVMSEAQQRSVVRWAMNKGTLSREMDSLGKPESAQIWKVLEGMGCLAYEMGV